MKIIAWIIAAPFIALGLFYLARFLFCGPDKKIEKIAFPLADVIVEDIKRNGVPATLKDIKGLPYVLNCSQINKEEDNSLEEECSFVYNKKPYQVYILAGINNKRINLYIDIEEKKKSNATLIQYKLTIKDGEQENPPYQPDMDRGVEYPKGQMGLYHGTGICKTWRLIQ